MVRYGKKFLQRQQKTIKQIRFTKEGLEKLNQEYEELLRQRPAVVADLKKAREMGDLKENGYYRASRMKLNFIDNRIMKITLEKKQAVIVDTSNINTVCIGSTVTITDGKREMTYTIAGDLEADPSNGKISLLSPLGKALEGKKIDEMVSITLPSGQTDYKILKIL
jgi:transcription elongation factor GreA